MRASVSVILLLAAFVPIESKANGFGHEEQVLIKTTDGKQLRATVRYPVAQQKQGRVGALLLFGGFEEAAKVLDLVHPKIPIVLASFDYPFEPPRKFEFPQSLKFAPEAKRAIREMTDGIVALTDYLAKRPNVDSLRITIIGASFGAPFALAAAARDERLRNIALVHGFADIPATVEHRIKSSWKPKIGFWATPAAWLLSRLGWLYLDAPSPEASIAKLLPSQNVLMISADEDTIVPRKSVEALWAEIQLSRTRHERVRMPGDHLQPGSGALIEKISEIVTAWIQRVYG
jgi:dienelactone hydrolase